MPAEAGFLFEHETVLRAAPCWFGLFSVVTLLYAQLSPCRTHGVQVARVGKQAVTFTDALAAMRRWVWSEWMVAMAGHQEAFAQLPDSFRNTLLSALAPPPEWLEISKRQA
jgi:hypothetical protein